MWCFLSKKKMPYLLPNLGKLGKNVKISQKSHFPHIAVNPAKFQQNIARKSKDIGKYVVFWSKKCHIYCPNLWKAGKNQKFSQKSHFSHIAVNPAKFKQKIARKSKDIGKNMFFWSKNAIFIAQIWGNLGKNQKTF